MRTLQRNISSQYYERTLLSQSKDAVRAEMVEITKPLQEKLEFIKNPVIAEFLGVKQDTSFTENDLETAILDNVREFLMELGKGYVRIRIPTSRSIRFSTATSSSLQPSTDFVFQVMRNSAKRSKSRSRYSSKSTRKIEDARLASAQPSHRPGPLRHGCH